jgi:putative transcriptional regulator
MLAIGGTGMAVENHFVELLAGKQAKEKRIILLSTVAKDTKVSRRAVIIWSKNKVTRYDAPVISAFCKYFSCSVGDLLEYVPDEDQP